MVDRIALEGIRRIGSSLVKTFRDGDDLEARTDMALGSMYGGMCLGPVNTAAVHALAYPLGSMYEVPHGLANALLLAEVLKFNMDAAIDRYADIGIALGAEKRMNNEETAKAGIEIIEDIMNECDLPQGLAEINFAEKDIDSMVESAMQVKRLLKNNVKDLSARDARDIYMKSF